MEIDFVAPLRTLRRRARGFRLGNAALGIPCSDMFGLSLLLICKF